MCSDYDSGRGCRVSGDVGAGATVDRDGGPTHKSIPRADRGSVADKFICAVRPPHI